MERVTVFLDLANIEASAPGRVDYKALHRYLGEGRYLQEAYAYVPVDPRLPQGRDGLINHLQQSGWMVHTKMGKPAGTSYKANVDVEMTIDMIQCAEIIRPDILVLCSGDGDFLPLIRFMRQRGVRIEVAAFQRAASREVRNESSGFIDLDYWYAECGRQFLQRTPDSPVHQGAPFPHQAGRTGTNPYLNNADYAFLRRPV